MHTSEIPEQVYASPAHLSAQGAMMTQHAALAGLHYSLIMVHALQIARITFGQILQLEFANLATLAALAATIQVQFMHALVA
jgi:hypothetical protein